MMSKTISHVPACGVNLVRENHELRLEVFFLSKRTRSVFFFFFDGTAGSNQ